MKGKLHLSFSETNKLERDLIYQKLLEPWEHDAMTEVILTHMLSGEAELLKRIFADHLEGGRWYEESLNPDIREKAKGLPKHNKFSETIFGHLDRLLREKPNITTVASEAMIMFSHNKTSEWLEAKTAPERAVLLREARKGIHAVRTSFKERHRKIQEVRRERLLEEMKAAKEMEQKRAQKKEDFTTDMIHWGLWQTEQAVDDAISGIKTKKEKTAALKAQLNFRQFVLQQKPPEGLKLYAFSKSGGGGRVIFGPSELAENLKMLIKHAVSCETVRREEDRTYETHMIVGKRVRHRFLSEEGEETFYTGKVISQVG